jgi:hypothetical protein
MPEDERTSPSRHLTLLAEGEVTVEGRMPWSSNQTFLATCSDGSCSTSAVYKPGRGERQLWDFPEGLYKREIAAYELSAALGWRVVPETVARGDAPFGPGSLQRFVPADFTQHYFTLLEDPSMHESLRRIAVFDLVANNADRKSGHCLLGEDGRVWAIDNALCFHADTKLRTVIWDFGGQRVPDELLSDLERVGRNLPASLRRLLQPAECDALEGRMLALLNRPVLPAASPDYRHYPWPLV